MNLEQVNNQRDRGFRFLRFEPELEAAFFATRIQALRERARPVALSALVLFLIYCVLDYVSFPERVWMWTVPIRLFVSSPVIILVLVLYPLTDHPRIFSRLYAFSYLWCSLSLVLIIAVARWQRVPMPYDGILLSLMFGYFLMGMSCRVVSSLSTIVVVAYLTMEWFAGTAHLEILHKSFFLLTAHGVGMVGSWLQEYGQRAHFLDRCQLDLGRVKAESESERKSRFVAIASHDLRQPLNVINLLLANLSAPSSPGERERIQDQLASSVDHLNRLLESLLDMSRLEEQLVRAVFEPVNVSDLLARVCRESRFTSSGGTRLELAPVKAGLWVRADPILLRRILQNLILNALQHADCQRIWLDAHLQGGRVVIEVGDDGRGIDPREQAPLFDPYTKGTHTSTAERGLGLGLAIVAQLTALMEGHCSLSSDVGAGCRFQLTFPQAQAPEGQVRKIAAGPKTEGAGALVWVIEPHQPSRFWLAQLLKRWGYRVRLVDRPQHLAGERPGSTPDLVITALHLEDEAVGGQDCLVAIRRWKADVPALILTADTLQRPGFNPHSRTWLIHKPVSAARLRTLVTRLLSAATESNTPVT